MGDTQLPEGFALVQEEGQMALPPQPKGLVFDLEVVPASEDKPACLIMLAGMRPDTGVELELKTSGAPLEALQQLDAMSQGASFVLGHNVVDHDLPLIRN